MFIFAKNKRCAATTGIPSAKHPGYSCTYALPNKKRVVPESTTLRHPDRGDSRDTRKHVALNTTNLQFQALASLSIQALRFAPLPSRAQTGTRNRYRRTRCRDRIFVAGIDEYIRSDSTVLP